MLFPTLVGRDVVRLGEEYGVDDDGFRSELVAATQKALAEIPPTSSVALLGEPGIGKSRGLDELTIEDENAVRIDLGTVADVSDLQERLSEVAAAGITRSRTLALDGIDECSIPAKSLFHHLEATLRGHHGLRVLLGCRAADWSETLGARLGTLLPELEVVELLPLSRRDVVDLAASRGVDGEAFLVRVVDAGAVPLATVPLTLDLLLVAYQQDGRLPDSARELYEQGILRLVEEPDPDREPAKKPAGSAPQRLAVAAKLAAYATLCNHSAGARAVPAPGTDLLAGQLAAGTEPIDGGDLTVTADLIDATLATALFTSRGGGRWGVRHASIAAYLTARYLTTHGVPENQLRALMTCTNSLGRTRVPSRLRETAAWLVSLHPERNGWLVHVDPDSIAAHARLVNAADVRQALVGYLLESPDAELRTRGRGWRLAHPDLADQLRPALRAPLEQDAGPDLGHPVSRRARVAVEIARRTGGQGSVPDLVDLLLDTGTNSYLRSSAAYALIDLDAATAAQTLRMVLDEVTAHPEHDPDDQLRGLALEANWPANLTPAQLVAALTPPQNGNLLGSYAWFLHHFLDDVDDQTLIDLIRTITSTGLTHSSATAHESADEQNRRQSATPTTPLRLLTGTRRGTDVMITLLSRALSSSQLEVMLDDVGWLIAVAVRNHQNIAVPARFEVTAGAESATARQLRRALVLAVLRHLPSSRARLLPIMLRGRGTGGLVVPADLEWLLSLGGTEWAAHAAQLIPVVFDPTDLEHQELVWAHRGEPIFNDSVGPWFDAVEINSPEADRMRQEDQWKLEREQRWAGAATHQTALDAAWAQCEQGEPEAFTTLCALLRVEPETGQPDWGDDLLSWPSVPLLAVNEETLRTSAERYLSSVGDTQDITSPEPLAPLSWRAFVGYVALAYLGRRQDGQTRLDALPGEVWRRWAPTVLCLATPGDSEIHTKLKAELRRRAPEGYRMWLLRCIEAITLTSWFLISLDDVECCYDEAVGERLDAVLRSTVDIMCGTAIQLGRLTAAVDNPPEARLSESDLRSTMSFAYGRAGELARFLVRRREQSRPWLRDLADGRGATCVEARALAAEVLIEAGLLAWDQAIASMQSDEDFGRALVLALARHRRDEISLTQPTGLQVAELWWWVDARWSSQTDTFVDGFVSDDQHVRDWRNQLVTELQTRTTPDALGALDRLVESRPEDPRLRSALLAAEARDHDESWQGVTVGELTALLSDAGRALVKDDDALYRVVLASLERFATRMHHVGQTLWNETRPDPRVVSETKVWAPKYEADVSAALCDHLRQEFGERLVVNREVQVRQTTSRGHGLAVDVLPTATEKASGRRLPSCPIEVKGCWNEHLLTDLQEQLVADYLPAVGATRGIYVCAWFATEDWDDLDDRRRKAAVSRDRDAIRLNLARAAQAASGSGKIAVTAVVIDIPRPRPSTRV